MNSISPASQYLLEYWDDLWNGMSSKLGLRKLFNPRLVIQELRDEILFNKQRNIANERFFQRLLGGYEKTDPASQARLQVHLKMILKELNVSKNRPKYLPALCDEALKSFSKFEYFEDCVVFLISLIELEELNDLHKQKIKIVANHLIVELRSIGYSDKEIREMPRKVFSEAQHINGHLMWQFPHSVRCDDWEDKAKVSAFDESILKEQAELNETKRLRALLTFAKRDKTAITFIFRVNGAVGTMELNIAGVTFYSPTRRTLVTDELHQLRNREYEWFGASKDQAVINAAVTLEALSSESSEPIARSLVEKSLSLLRRVAASEAPLWLSKSFIAVDQDGSLVHTSHHAFERREDRYFDYLQLVPEQQVGLDARLSLIEKTREVAIRNGWGRRFEEACYWLRKAEESTPYADQLLSYWICIETLCAKSENDATNWYETKNHETESDIYLIKEVVGRIVAVSECYQQGWLLRRQLKSVTENTRQITLSNIVREKALLNTQPGQTIYLVNLIECCDEIINELSPGLLQDQVAEINSFYQDREVALSVLSDHLETARDELVFIYRMRNKIAHDGSSDHFLLPSLCQLAGRYAHALFHKIGLLVQQDEDGELSSLLIKASQQYDRIEVQLQTENPLSVFLSASSPN